MSGNGIGWGKKFFKVWKKSENFILSQGKLTVCGKVRENSNYNTADVIPLKAGKNISGHCYLNCYDEEGELSLSS